MGAQQMGKEKELSLEDKQAIIETAKKQLKAEIKKDGHNRQAAIDDLEFVYGEHAQWDVKERQLRESRDQQILQINVLPKYSDQITGEIRMNKTKIKVVAASGDASKEIADVKQGIICDIEHSSSAESIYDTAGKGLVDCGYGAFRAITEYTESNPFEQKLKIIGIDDPLTSVYMDSHGKEKNYRDAQYGFVLQNMSKEDFKREFDKTDDEVPGSKNAIVEDIGVWYDDDSVTIAEYFYKEYEKEHLALLSDGRIMTEDKAKDEIKKSEAIYQQKRIDDPGAFIDDSHIPKIEQDREVNKTIVHWVKMTSDEILNKTTWPGTLIPVSMGHGKVVVINGRRYVSGLIRNAKDAQKMLNYWHTTAVETIALAPKNPLLLTAVQIEGHEKDYKRMHETNPAWMLYNSDPAAPGPPQRLAPSNPSPAIFSELNRAEQNVENTIGMHKADVGNAGRELSGTAIEARQMPGHISTYVYQDNLTKMIGYMGEILVDAIPGVYDTERDARIRREDNTEEYVPINTTIGKATELTKKEPEKFSGIDPDKLNEKVEQLGPNEKYNDMTEGKYSVVVTAGPAYETRRQESAANMLQFMQISATSTPLDKYFYLNNSDFEGADDYAEAIRKQIPYGTLKPKPGEKPPPQQPPNPVQMAELEIKKLDRQVQEAKQINEAERYKTERIKQQKEILKIQQEAQESGVKIQGEVAKTISAINKQSEPNA